MQDKDLTNWSNVVDNSAEQEQSHGADGQPVTVEAEYSFPGNDDAVIQQWTFKQESPSQAKEVVETHYVPLEATLWRIGVWYGTSEDRPDSGHETGILRES